MRIGVIGINHKLAEVSLRELVARACQRRFFLENPLTDGAFVLLSTCNRCELYFSANDLVLAHQDILQILKEEMCACNFEQRLYTFFGLDCFVHLAKVTAGLDSAIVAETEIQGQVRAAYAAACEMRTLCKELHILFQKSLKVAKEVRTRYTFEKSLPDLEHALYFRAMAHFHGPLPRVLFVGASEINVKVARFFSKKGVSFVFCNRSQMSLHHELGCEVLCWDDLEAWREFEWVICATKSPHYLLKYKGQELSSYKKLLVDLAVPRNIDPRLEGEGSTLVNIDHLQQLLQSRKEALYSQIAKGEEYLVSSVIRQVTSFQKRSSDLALKETMIDM